MPQLLHCQGLQASQLHLIIEHYVKITERKLLRFSSP